MINEKLIEEDDLKILMVDCHYFHLKNNVRIYYYYYYSCSI